MSKFFGQMLERGADTLKPSGADVTRGGLLVPVVPNDFSVTERRIQRMFSKSFDRVVFVQEELKVEDSYRRGGSFVGSAGRSIVKGRDLSQSQGSATLFSGNYALGLRTDSTVLVGSTFWYLRVWHIHSRGSAVLRQAWKRVTLFLAIFELGIFMQWDTHRTMPRQVRSTRKLGRIGLVESCIQSQELCKML